MRNISLAVHIAGSTGSISIYDSVSGPSRQGGGDEHVNSTDSYARSPCFGQKGSRRRCRWADRASGGVRANGKLQSPTMEVRWMPACSNGAQVTQ